MWPPAGCRQGPHLTTAAMQLLFTAVHAQDSEAKHWPVWKAVQAKAADGPEPACARAASWYASGCTHSSVLPTGTSSARDSSSKRTCSSMHTPGTGPQPCHATASGCLFMKAGLERASCKGGGGAACLKPCVAGGTDHNAVAHARHVTLRSSRPHADTPALCCCATRRALLWKACPGDRTLP
jgi:hypothetical protein